MAEVFCVGIFALLFGVLVCLAGYRLFLVLLPIWGFFAGFALGAGLVTLLLGEGFLATVTGWVGGAIIGLVFAVLSYLFYFIGVAIFAGSVGYSWGAGLIYLILPNASIIAFIVGLVGALIVAVITLGLNLQKWVIIAITALGGSSAVLTAIMLFFGRVSLADIGTNPIQPVLRDSIFWFVAWIALAVIGFVIQAITTSTYVIEVPEDSRSW